MTRLMLTWFPDISSSCKVTALILSVPRLVILCQLVPGNKKNIKSPCFIFKHLFKYQYNIQRKRICPQFFYGNFFPIKTIPSDNVANNFQLMKQSSRTDGLSYITLHLKFCEAKAFQMLHIIGAELETTSIQPQWPQSLTLLHSQWLNLKEFWPFYLCKKVTSLCLRVLCYLCNEFFKSCNPLERFLSCLDGISKHTPATQKFSLQLLGYTELIPLQRLQSIYMNKASMWQDLT